MDRIKTKHILTVFFMFALAAYYLPRLDMVKELKISMDVYTVVHIFQGSFIFFLAFLSTSYKMLSLKTFLLAGCILEFLNACIYIYIMCSGYKFSVYWVSLPVMAVATYSWLVFICYRDYYKTNDELDEDHFFMVGTIPHDFHSFWLSVFNNPFGGIGIYAKGVFYHYHKGELKESDKRLIERMPHKYRVVKKGRIDPNKAEPLLTLRCLKQSKYNKWSWRYNCKTVLEPLLRKG